MTEEPLAPARDEFVLHVGAAASDVLERARELGAVERFDAAPHLCLLRVKSKATPKEAWQSTTRGLGAGSALYPVLRDQDGAPHYPTGEVTLRFDTAPSDADLERFCDAQGLQLLRRAASVAQQVVCQPKAAGHEFLPDLITRLASQPGVRRAWANTLSHYRREGTSAPGHDAKSEPT